MESIMKKKIAKSPKTMSKSEDMKQDKAMMKKMIEKSEKKKGKK